VDEVMPSHHWRVWSVLLAVSTERRAEASSHKFATYSPGVAMLFDLVSDDDVRGVATGWWLQRAV